MWKSVRVIECTDLVLKITIISNERCGSQPPISSPDQKSDIKKVVLYTVFLG